MNNENSIPKKQLKKLLAKLKEFEKQRLYNDEWHNLYKEKRILQRNLSLAKNQETAVLLDYPYPWDAGAPLPHVVSDGGMVFLIYYIDENSSAWKAQTHEIIDLDTGHRGITALVEFKHCYNYKFGGVNEEVIHGHPLYEHGLEPYGVHEIINSKWIIEQEKINSVHGNYNHLSWEAYKHFIFTFHDELFECIAEGYNIKIFKGRICSVFSEVTKKLFDR